ncbi:AraC family transcriptional regulator [Pleionea sediminis]|uniref:AraC family transcriptional regulator n=1 Tax=Pleionea sediminis TaxID=2569479 RepID=UPI0013DE73B5|nr:AraC family transcriptional regulator [Pleionea sediminis]
MSMQQLIELSLSLMDINQQFTPLSKESEGFSIINAYETSQLDATLYEPVICLILQGAKELVTGDSKFTFAKGEFLVVSHDLPVSSRIVQADNKNPYVALVLSLNINIFRGLYEQVGELTQTMAGSNAMEVATASPLLIDAFYRLVKSTQNEAEYVILFHQILKEIHFRLLLEPSGGMLRDLLKVDSHASHIAKSLKLIRNQFNETINVPNLAKSVGMSASSFHQHFKTVTGSTPLQYQKELRLLEARKLIRVDRESVTNAAYQVGYESPSQFSREYTRKFNVNPRVDGKSHP